jgi:hypothetical protein
MASAEVSGLEPGFTGRHGAPESSGVIAILWLFYARDKPIARFIFATKICLSDFAIICLKHSCLWAEKMLEAYAPQGSGQLAQQWPAFGGSPQDKTLSPIELMSEKCALVR